MLLYFQARLSRRVRVEAKRTVLSFIFLFSIIQAELAGGTGKQHATGPLGTHHSETLQGSFARRKKRGKQT